MSNHAHRRKQGALPDEPPDQGGFIQRLLGFGPSRRKTGPAVAGLASSRVEAELMAGYLRSHGIKAAVSADDEGGLGPNLQVLQRVRVLVPRDQEDRARALLDERE